jgi:hypothetical protein
MGSTLASGQGSLLWQEVSTTRCAIRITVCAIRADRVTPDSSVHRQARGACCIGQIGVGQVSVIQDDGRQRGTRQVGTGQVGVSKGGALQVDICQVGAGQVGTSQIAVV